MIRKPLYAHSKEAYPPEEWQRLEDHLSNVARKAATCAKKFNSADWAWNSAWLHDLGKAADEFQAYLLRQNGLDDAEYDGTGKGRVNHSSAGAAFAEEKFGAKKERGAYWGRRVAAKKDSNRKRRENDKASVAEQTVRPEYGLIKTDDCFVIGFGMEINGFLC